MENILFVAK